MPFNGTNTELDRLEKNVRNTVGCMCDCYPGSRRHTITIFGKVALAKRLCEPAYGGSTDKSADHVSIAGLDIEMLMVVDESAYDANLFEPHERPLELRNMRHDGYFELPPRATTYITGSASVHSFPFIPNVRRRLADFVQPVRGLLPYADLHDILFFKVYSCGSRPTNSPASLVGKAIQSRGDAEDVVQILKALPEDGDFQISKDVIHGAELFPAGVRTILKHLTILSEAENHRLASNICSTSPSTIHPEHTTVTIDRQILREIASTSSLVLRV